MTTRSRSVSRRAAWAAFASIVLTAPPQGRADTPPAPQFPLAQCDSRVNDITDDGTVNWNPQAGSRTDDPRGSVDALDITAVTIRITPTRVYAFMSLVDVPATMPPTDTAYGYTMWFTHGTKTARFAQVLVNPAQASVGPAGYPTASVGEGTAGGTAPMRGIGGGVDATGNVAYVYADRDSLEEQLGEALRDGDTLTAITGKSVLFIGAGSTAAGVTQRPADDAQAATATYTVGQDVCFAPSTVATANAVTQYGDRVTVSATLTGDAGTPLAGRTVRLTVPGEAAPRTLTTGANGAVSTAVTPLLKAGTYAFTFSYAGDDFSGSGTGRGTLTVKPEAVRLAALKVAKPSATTRTVTTTLTEDDPRALAKQPVDWYVDGRKVATVLTDATGRSVFKGARPGQRVQARFAGVAGRYGAAASNAVTA